MNFVIADDSGLEVDALGGAPGIFSARYAGETASDPQNVDKLLRELKNVAHRSARFRCVIALARAGRVLGTFEGAVEGKIVDFPRGNAGFGYDPVFQPAGLDQTFGETRSWTEKQNQSPRQSDRCIAASFARNGELVRRTRWRRWGWSTRSTRSARSSGPSRAAGGCANLITDFLNLCAADFVEHGNNVTV